MNHQPSCVEATQRWEKIKKEYIDRWPGHCKKCNGWGGFYSTFDPSPPGVSLGSGHMIDYDPCAECVDALKCARCGAANPEWEDKLDGYFICKQCGWTTDEGQADGIPQPPECNCAEYCGKCSAYMGLNYGGGTIEGQEVCEKCWIAHVEEEASLIGVAGLTSEEIRAKHKEIHGNDESIRWSTETELLWDIIVHLKEQLKR